ncbi:gibberellin 20 oxidase 3-like [Lycium barbarum]|uniref:gibberellin 20 oxidase 3-like n=1 Tax=Lycium barbarum TaxID=112863 RepID=UPI00293F0AE4|nr:gibberellin 20 oxidase 3-like [Lycium barbarum]
MEMLARGLGLEDDFFSKNFEEKEATIFRISRYPPWPLPEIVGTGIHSDPQTLTILCQDLVGGLQAWTNGRLKNVIHRVVVNKENQKLSVAYFMNPTSSATIECLHQLIDPVSNPRKYVPFTWAELRHLLLTTRRLLGTNTTRHKSKANKAYKIRSFRAFHDNSAFDIVATAVTIVD